jgi:hypothetical protein
MVKLADSLRGVAIICSIRITAPVRMTISLESGDHKLAQPSPKQRVVLVKLYP